jgi:acetylornithine deacetylase
MIPKLKEDILNLLSTIISLPSFSKEEEKVADVIRDFLSKKEINFNTYLNNTWAYNEFFDSKKPTILLNSHIDTVKPNVSYTNNPFEPILLNGKLFGLGANDAGASLVTLLGAFLFFYDKENLPFNICFAATAEEEISGVNGIASISDIVNKCSFAIIGEPTGMQMAIAEKGLIVVDAVVEGIAGHAARDEGKNAIYLALEDILWIKNFQFERKSSLLGPIKMTTTIIQAGKQHNVVPDLCTYTIDIRTTAEYTYEEILETINNHTHAKVTPRSTRLKPSKIELTHPLVVAGHTIGLQSFGSSTLSDQALINIPSIKIGPGLSERSHTADEFIFISEIEDALHIYIDLLGAIVF